MGAPSRWILENQLGQKVRSFRIEADKITVIRRLDTGRVEIVAGLEKLDHDLIPYEVLKSTTTKALAKEPYTMKNGAVIRSASESESLQNKSYVLAEEQDDAVMTTSLKKSSIGHAAAIAVIIGASLLTGYLAKKEEEPALVTIDIPKEKETPKQKVQMSEQKIVKQKMIKNARVVSRPVPKPKPQAKKIVQKTVEKRRSPVVVRNAPVRNMERVGALAALGGLKNGARSAQGLDSQSMKNIRSAGSGGGGGGVGAGSTGGMKGMMPGSGLIAGSAGGGGSAQSAGGYGTRGSGGGRAGYGKIKLVGGTSGITLPLDDEALVQGGLDRDQILAVINRNKGQIVSCYEKGLQNEPDLRGRVSIQFVIGGGGRITVASVAQSSLGSSSVEGCMVARMRSWQFPRPQGNVNVDVLYPFDLRRLSSR